MQKVVTALFIGLISFSVFGDIYEYKPKYEYVERTEYVAGSYPTDRSYRLPVDYSKIPDGTRFLTFKEIEGSTNQSLEICTTGSSGECEVVSHSCDVTKVNLELIEHFGYKFIFEALQVAFVSKPIKVGILSLKLAYKEFKVRKKALELGISKKEVLRTKHLPHEGGDMETTLQRGISAHSRVDSIDEFLTDLEPIFANACE